MKKTQNLENLHVFCEIVRTGSVKAASDALNTETSNAFRTVRQLEDELGVALFDRDKRPMQLTAYGTQFYRYSSKILKLHHQMLEELKDDTEAMAGRITVCSTAGFRQMFLTPSLVEFQMDHPNIVIDLREIIPGCRTSSITRRKAETTLFSCISRRTRCRPGWKCGSAA